jgi:hypothetical protein
MSELQAFVVALGLLAAGTLVARTYLSRQAQIVLAAAAAAAHFI